MVAGSDIFPSPGLGTADYNDVREEIKFENQNSIPHYPAPSISSASHISAYDFLILWLADLKLI
jgi:hypothetical protein